MIKLLISDKISRLLPKESKKFSKSFFFDQKSFLKIVFGIFLPIKVKIPVSFIFYSEKVRLLRIRPIS